MPLKFDASRMWFKIFLLFYIPLIFWFNTSPQSEWNTDQQICPFSNIIPQCRWDSCKQKGHNSWLLAVMQTEMTFSYLVDLGSLVMTDTKSDWLFESPLARSRSCQSKILCSLFQVVFPLSCFSVARLSCLRPQTRKIKHESNWQKNRPIRASEHTWIIAWMHTC